MLQALIAESRIERALAHALLWYPRVGGSPHPDADESGAQRRALRAARELEAAAARLGDDEAMALFAGAALLLEDEVQPNDASRTSRLAQSLALAGIPVSDVEEVVALAAKLQSVCAGHSLFSETEVIRRIPEGTPVRKRGLTAAYALRSGGEAGDSRAVTIIQPFALMADEVLLASGRTIPREVVERLAESHLASVEPDQVEKEALIVPRTVYAEPGRGAEVGVESGERKRELRGTQKGRGEASRRKFPTTTIFLAPAKRRKLKVLAAEAGLDLSEYVERELGL